jgi:hypothetical protein
MAMASCHFRTSLIGDLSKVAFPEPHRFQRRGSILLPAFEIQDTTSAGFADDRTDDGAYGADDVVYLDPSSENYVFR